MLMFQPETGNISLNYSDEASVSSHWWQLIVRQRPQQGEVLTIFLPMDIRALLLRE